MVMRQENRLEPEQIEPRLHGPLRDAASAVDEQPVAVVHDRDSRSRTPRIRLGRPCSKQADVNHGADYRGASSLTPPSTRQGRVTV
jgi:hypothetical protein